MRVAPASIGYAQMSALLREPRNDDKDRDRASRTTVLYIDDAPYTNSAAKFWPTLIDELLEEYPSATAFELTAPAPSVLTPRCLDPAAALEESLERLKNVDIRAAMASTLAELELLFAQQERVIGSLRGLVERRRPDWDPELRKVFEQNAALVDAAVEECRRAVKRLPGDPELKVALAEAYSRKVDFLKTFSGLEENP